MRAQRARSHRGGRTWNQNNTRPRLPTLLTAISSGMGRKSDAVCASRQLWASPAATPQVYRMCSFNTRMYSLDGARGDPWPWCTHLVHDFQQLPILQHRRSWTLLWPPARGEALRTAARLDGRRNGMYPVNSCTSADKKPGALHWASRQAGRSDGQRRLTRAFRGAGTGVHVRRGVEMGCCSITGRLRAKMACTCTCTCSMLPMIWLPVISGRRVFVLFCSKSASRERFCRRSASSSALGFGDLPGRGGKRRPAPLISGDA
jgi:hypothetical protein